MLTRRYCGACGVPYACDDAQWPRTCGNCNRTAWLNPVPVSVLLFTVNSDRTGELGLLAGRRCGTVARAGEWGLPGGYVGPDETLEEAACRELEEETGLGVMPYEVAISHSVKNPAENQVLTFSLLLNPRSESEVRRAFRPSDECDAVRILHAPFDLAFPSHTEALHRFLRGTLPRSL